MSLVLSGVEGELGRRLAAETRAHLAGHILPFWRGPAVDHERGGWMAWLANDLTPDRSQPKGLIVHSRILWAFSAVHQTMPHAADRELAARAYDYLTTRFWDAEHGGFYWQLDDSGAVIDASKKIYGQAFCVYALAEYARAFGRAPALARAGETHALIERYAHDPRHGGYAEVLTRNWSAAGPRARLSEKDLAAPKSMNNHLHVLEACTNLQRVAPSGLIAGRLRELIALFLARILDSESGHLHHFFSESWAVRSESHTFGHDIEASWLLCEAAEVLGDAALLRAVRETARHMAERVLAEAVAPDGGVYYEGRAGRILDHGRECWPQAEALVGFLNAFELSRERKFLAAAARVWDFIQDKLVDRAHGEWFWRVREDGSVDPSLPKVSEWKGPYHATRACLETMRRLDPAGPASGRSNPSSL